MSTCVNKCQLSGLSYVVNASAAVLRQGVATSLSAYQFLEEWQPSVLSSRTSDVYRLVNRTTSAGW